MWFEVMIGVLAALVIWHYPKRVFWLAICVVAVACSLLAIVLLYFFVPWLKVMPLVLGIAYLCAVTIAIKRRSLPMVGTVMWLFWALACSLALTDESAGNDAIGDMLAYAAVMIVWAVMAWSYLVGGLDGIKTEIYGWIYKRFKHIPVIHRWLY